jgi:hypothetical protein
MTTYIKIGFVDTKDELLRVYESLVSTNTKTYFYFNGPIWQHVYGSTGPAR